MDYLTEDEPYELADALRSAGFGGPSVRSTLLEGVEQTFADDLVTADTPRMQIVKDLSRMSRTERLGDGSTPLFVWLRNAIRMLGSHQEAALFRAVAERIGLPGIPAPRPSASSRGGLPVSPAPDPTAGAEPPAPEANNVPPAWSSTAAPTGTLRGRPTGTYGERPVPRVLFLAADPLSEERLALDHEIRVIDAELRAAPGRARIDVVQKWAVRPEEISGFLYDTRPLIVHFSGHGSPQGQLLFEDASGDTARVGAAPLAGVLAHFAPPLRCVVLSACWSQTVAGAIAEHVDVVVGMAREVDEVAAVAFCRGFYQSVARGADIASAVDMGRQQIALLNLGPTDIPVAITRPGVDLTKLVLVPQQDILEPA